MVLYMWTTEQKELHIKRDNIMEQKLVHVYHGDGKGKTTAAIGLAIRAAGNGNRVIFSQFMKGQQTGELEILKSLENIEVYRSDRDFPFYSQMNDKQKRELTDIHNGILESISKAAQAGEVDMVIMDEITYPYAWNLIDRQMLCSFIERNKGRVEIILTGRNPDQFMIDQADYITEMKCVRHPYEKGIGARKGIEY